VKSVTWAKARINEKKASAEAVRDTGNGARTGNIVDAYCIPIVGISIRRQEAGRWTYEDTDSGRRDELEDDPFPCGAVDLETAEEPKSDSDDNPADVVVWEVSIGYLYEDSDDQGPGGNYEGSR
jgi:hypothetical protein